MKPATAAHLALCLGIVGLGMALLGMFAQLGDPDPRISREVIASQQRFYGPVFFTGASLMAGSLWLAGFAYAEARIRAVLATAIVVLPLLALGIWILVA